MSALPGKVVVEGVLDVGGTAHFLLSFLQARNPSWCRRPFLAEFDPTACWLSDLRPPGGVSEFFYAAELREMLHEDGKPYAAAPHCPAEEPEDTPATIAV
jgi:hypothetical protein